MNVALVYAKLKTKLSFLQKAFMLKIFQLIVLLAENYGIYQNWTRNKRCRAPIIFVVQLHKLKQKGA
jgi:hypothetical protein